MKDVIDRIQILYPSYDYETFIIRFTRGQVTPAGRILHYPRVPFGSSISRDESYDSTPTAGTLGVYRSISGRQGRYALTAGHCVRPVHHRNMRLLFMQLPIYLKHLSRSGGMNLHVEYQMAHNIRGQSKVRATHKSRSNVWHSCIQCYSH